MERVQIFSLVEGLKILSFRAFSSRGSSLMQSIAETCVRFDAAHLFINLVSEIALPMFPTLRGGIRTTMTFSIKMESAYAVVAYIVYLWNLGSTRLLAWIGSMRAVPKFELMRV